MYSAVPSHRDSGGWEQAVSVFSLYGTGRRSVTLAPRCGADFLCQASRSGCQTGAAAVSRIGFKPSHDGRAEPDCADECFRRRRRGLATNGR